MPRVDPSAEGASAMPDLPDLLVIDDIVDRYGVNEWTVRQWLTSGELRGYKLGKAWRIDPADWEAFLRRRRDAAGVDEDPDDGTDAPVTVPRARTRRRA